MSTRHYLSGLKKKYRICYLHNPKHFFLNTLWIEDLPNGNKLLRAHPRPHSKPFTQLAILKPIENSNQKNNKKLLPLFPGLRQQAKFPALLPHKKQGG